MKHITTHQAKRIIAKALDNLDLPPYKLTARTISFSDLAREDCIFVTIHDWQPSPTYDNLRRIAGLNGFRIQTSNL